MISVYKRSSIINSCRVNEWMQLYTGTFWHFQPRGMSLALKKKKSTWISDEGIPASSFHSATGSKLSAISVFPILFVFPSWHAVWLCLHFESRFWTKVLRSWLGNMVWLSLGGSFLWCKCTKIIGKTCHALNSLLRSTIWAYQPLPIQSEMNICLCPRRMRREGCPGLVMWLRSPGDIQSAMEVPCLHSGIYAQPGTMTNFSFSTLLTVLTLSLGSWGERLLCLKEQHLSLGNFVCVWWGVVLLCLFFCQGGAVFPFPW